MTVQGFDASHHNGQVDWPAVPAACRFVFLKATEGTQFRDTSYVGNVTGAQSRNMYCGPYHFLNAEDPIQQARHFASQVGTPGAGYLPPIVDFEGPVLSLGRTECARRLRAFMAEADSLTGRRCGIYLSDSVVDWLGASWASLSAGRLQWIARYSSSPPAHPWHVWQSAQYGHVPGVGSGDVDLDVFNGTEADLAVWANVRRKRSLTLHERHLLHKWHTGAHLSEHELHELHVLHEQGLA